MVLKLQAPPAFWVFHKDTLAELVNGCGPGGWKGVAIPDTVYGLSIKQACDIHDFMYLYGETEAERKEADQWFSHNMHVIVVNHYEASTLPSFLKNLMLFLRRRRIKKYYLFVRAFGGSYFWTDDKHPMRPCIETSY
jgi:hypothetical protein